MPTKSAHTSNVNAYHFPLKFRKYIAVTPNAGRQELLMMQLNEFRSLCTTSFSYDKKWTD